MGLLQPLSWDAREEGGGGALLLGSAGGPCSTSAAQGRGPRLRLPSPVPVICERKRQFRQLWIARINAAARLNGLSYSKFMYGLKLAEVDINRKMLAEMAVHDAEGFKSLAELAKSKLA